MSWIGGDDRASRASEKAQPSLRRSLSFGPSSGKTSKERDLESRRGRSVESLRMLPRFESYALPTKSYSQKIAPSSFGKTGPPKCLATARWKRRLANPLNFPTILNCRKFRALAQLEKDPRLHACPGRISSRESRLSGASSVSSVLFRSASP